MLTLMKNEHLIEYEQASDEVREIYDDIMQVMCMLWVLNWFKRQALTPQLLKGNWQKIKSTLFEGDIPLLLKQLILFKVSYERGCKYCTFVHKKATESLAENSDTIECGVTDDIYQAQLPRAYRTAMDVVSRCALEPFSTSEKDFEALIQVGFSEAEITELFAQADLVNMLNTFADIQRIEIDDEFFTLHE